MCQCSLIPYQIAGSHQLTLDVFLQQLDNLGVIVVANDKAKRGKSCAILDARVFPTC